MPIYWDGGWLPIYRGGRWACLAAGRAGGDVYVVLVREALAGGLSRHDPFRENIVVRCYCEKYVKNKTCHVVIPAVANPVAVLLTVNVNKSVGYITFLYRPWYQLANRTVIFGDSGVYIDLPEGAEVGVKEEVLGPVLSRCSYVVNASLNPAELRLGEPLHNSTGRYFRIG